ncbi:MAG: undecaprenyl-diphosphate phosphatase [Chitinophagaceae bacterium]|nr:MAG: undecaprenyl-diphosphate phosphatase [Chitinophagaceae bacterium]
MTVFEAIVIAIVEGITEFIPISSTGHMIIATKLLNVPSDDFTKMFTVAIQLGAILAVVVLYYKNFFVPRDGWKKQLEFYMKLAAGVIPALLFGFLFSDKIDEMLESTTTVAISLLVGGVFLLFIDKMFNHPVTEDARDVSFKQSVIIGTWQCLAMIPGVSRSAASIIGGMQQKLTRSAAAEFSFFLAVPTMLAATTYKLFGHYQDTGGFTAEEIKLLTIGNAVAFVVAMMAIKFFISFLKKYGFRFWGIYRIIVGIILLVMVYTGKING